MTWAFLCRKCKCSINMKNMLIDFNEGQQFVLCNDCHNSSKLYSKTFCLKQLLLSKSDIAPLKYLHNKNTKIKYYLDEDIENIVKTKFDKIEKNKIKKMEKAKQLEFMKHERLKVLVQRLSEYKLEYKPYGDCYLYVAYGYPDIETVVRNEINKSIELSRRKKILYKELQKFNLSYSDTQNSICYEFINGITDKSINEVVNDAKIENFFINFTDYLDLRKVYDDDDVAKEKALANYIKKTDETNRHEIALNIIDNIFNINITQ